MKVKVTTDWHVAAKRVAGTTPSSALAMQDHILASLHDALDPTYPHLIAGDLLDQFTIDSHNLIRAYELCANFIKVSGKELVLLRGNHDFSPRGTQKSSFDLLGSILTAQFSGQVKVVTEVTEWRQFVLVPHLPNNDLLRLEVEKLADVKNRVIVFHANYDNFHAADSVSSLNLTEAMVAPLIANGNTVVLGHEHDHRKLFNGKLLVLGNGVPASVADCLGSKSKFAAYFDDTDYVLEEMVKVSDLYAEVDWTDLDDAPEKAFIRVTGTATAEQAAEVVAAVAKLRQRSDSYVVSNAVRVEGLADFETLSQASFEDIGKVDVLELLLEEFTAEEAKVIKGLLAC